MFLYKSGREAWNRSFPYNSQKKPTLWIPWSQTSSLWNYKKIILCCLLGLKGPEGGGWGQTGGLLQQGGQGLSLQGAAAPQTVSLQLPLLLSVLSHCGHLLLPADSRPSGGRETALLNHTPGVKCLPPAICIEDGFGSFLEGHAGLFPSRRGRGGPRLSTEAGGGEGGSVWVPVQRVIIEFWEVTFLRETWKNPWAHNL